MLDGARNSTDWDGGDLFEVQSYEAVGRYVVRHYDLLLAVWDGRAGAGRGGTHDIVDYATRIGVPVWWIHASEEAPPRWLADQLDLRAAPEHGSSSPRRCISISPGSSPLRQHLRTLIEPHS